MAEKQGIPCDDHHHQQPSPVPMNAWQPTSFPQMPWPTQSQQPIVIQMVPARRGPTIRDKYKGHQSRALGITQIVAAILGIIFNSIGWWLNDWRTWRTSYDYDQGPGSTWGRYYYYRTQGYYASVGLWGAAFFVLSGAFAITAGKTKTTCFIVTHMVLSTVAAVFATMMFGFSVWAVSQDAYRLQEGFYDTRYHYPVTPQYNGTEYGHNPAIETIGYDERSASRGKTSMAISVFMLLVSITEIVACVWSSTLTCRVCCCAAPTQEAVSPRVQYMPAAPGGQQPQYIFLGAPSNTQDMPVTTGGQQVMAAQLPPIQPGGPQPTEQSKGDVTTPPPYQ